jgi:two-component system sensor histidine kinase KdpD
VVLALVGPGIAAEDQMVLNAFAAQLATVVEHGRLRVEASHARALGEANALRTALLQAVSHDLRTPLAAIKASATSLADTEMVWSPEDTAQFVATINEQTDRLTGLVGNLLDMSRIQAGAVTPTLRPVGLEEVVPGVVAALGLPPDAVDIDLPPTVPPVLADPALLERSLANVIDNSARFAPPGRPVRVEAGAVGGVVDVRVVDRGPGIPDADRDRVFQPFQRLGDNPNGEGVGLGLAVAEGFVTTMGGTIEVDETPGGGATIVITLPAAPEPSTSPTGARAAGRTGQPSR